MLVSISIIILFGAAHSISAQDYTLTLSEPKNMNELNSIIIKLLKEKRFEESLFYLDKILEIEPNNIKALTSKATAFSNMGEYVKALELYNKVLSIDKYNAEIGNEIVNLLSKTPIIPVSGSYDKNNDESIIDVQIRVTVRNASGELVAVIEDSHGRYMPVSFTDYVFDQLFEKEIVEINDQKFEVGKKTEVYQSDNDYIGNFWYEAQMSGYNISVFEVYPPHVGVEPSDQLQVEWTVSKKLD